MMHLEWILDTALKPYTSRTTLAQLHMYRRVGRTRLSTLITVSRRASESLVVVLQLEICTTYVQRNVRTLLCKPAVASAQTVAQRVGCE